VERSLTSAGKREIVMVKKSSSKKNEETRQLKTSSGPSKSYREAVDEFLAKRSDFSKRGGNISAVLPQGSPGPLKEGHKLDEEELDEE